MPRTKLKIERVMNKNDMQLKLLWNEEWKYRFPKRNSGATSTITKGSASGTTLEGINLSEAGVTIVVRAPQEMVTHRTDRKHFSPGSLKVAFTRAVWTGWVSKKNTLHFFCLSKVERVWQILRGLYQC